jgi:quinol monooxygenase YgiN
LFEYGSGQRDRPFTSSQGLCPDWNNDKGASVIIVRIAMHALPEKQKEVLQTLLSMIESTGKERGCLSHHVFRDIEDENGFSLIDEWETREDLDQHMRSAKFGVLLGTNSLLCEPLKIQIFTV